MNLLSLIMLLYITRQDGDNKGANTVFQLHIIHFLVITVQIISSIDLESPIATNHKPQATCGSFTTTNTQPIRQQHISACVLDARSPPTIMALQRCSTMPDLPKVATEVVMEEAVATVHLSSNIMAERAAASAEEEEEERPPSSQLLYKIRMFS